MGPAPDNPSLGAEPTAPPNAGPAAAPNGETPQDGARRLFPEAYSQAMHGAQPQELLEGAQPGRPVPVSAEYGWPADLARWVLPDDERNVSGDMFAAMWPIAMARNGYIVPMVKDGRSVCEFGVSLDGDHWGLNGAGAGALPAGQVHDLETAAARLRAALGQETKVRPVVFVPSGFFFAVGDNVGREAAVPLEVCRYGPGIGDPGTMATVDLDFTKVYSPEELGQLLEQRYR